jgi:hypothetical protein
MQNKKPKPATARQLELIQKAQLLHQSGKLVEAEAQYRLLLAELPDHATLLTNLGNIALQKGRLEEGVALISKSVKIAPNQPVALNNLGNALKSLNRKEEAIVSYDCAIARNPGYAEAYSNRGSVLTELNRLDAALFSLNKAIKIKPDYAAAYSNRGNVLKELKRLDEALASFDKAIALNPGYALAILNRANTLNDLKRFEEALAGYDRVIALIPSLAEAHSSRGAALVELKRLNEALASFDYAIALNPRYAEAHYNQGNAFLALNCLNEAQVCYDKAIDIRPDYAEAHWNKALLKILAGDFAEGWALYEWRWQQPWKKPAKVCRQPLWTGEQPLLNRTLLIYPEQGMGDYLQFIRYATLAEQLGGRVILEAPAALLSLVSSLKGNFTLVEAGQALPDFDCQCPLMSLPLAFKTTPETIPAQIPYLYADQARQQVWRQRLGEKSRPRVGLVWSGSSEHKNDSNRSIALQRFAPLLDLPFEFHSLQKEIRPEDARFLVANGKVENHQDLLSDFADTAALVMEMDLVISVDTSVAHLAGALGREMWILLSYAPDFRWMLERTDSLWYPSARLFRQSAPGDWSGAMTALTEQLETRIRSW